MMNSKIFAVLAFVLVGFAGPGCSLLGGDADIPSTTQAGPSCPSGDVLCSTAGVCCPSQTPYLCNNKCYSNASKCGSTYETCSGGNGSGTGTGTTGGNHVSGCCPAGSNKQCSQMVPSSSCGVQSCSCYYSGSSGDTQGAYYRTSTGTYFDCDNCGTSTPNCTNAANQAAAAIISCQ